MGGNKINMQELNSKLTQDVFFGVNNTTLNNRQISQVNSSDQSAQPRHMQVESMEFWCSNTHLELSVIQPLPRYEYKTNPYLDIFIDLYEC